MASVLSAAHFHNEEAAYAYVEARLWPEGPVCPHCGAAREHVGRLQGKTTRIGLHKCYACRKPFTVKIGTIFEASHCPLRLWLQAIHLLCSSKKGISTRQLQRTLGVGMKTAWFLGHRIREAMDHGYVHPEGQMGGSGSIVEADETFVGPNPQKDTRLGLPRHSREHLMAIYALVERGGEVRSFHIKRVDKPTVMGIMQDQVHAQSRIMTDEGTPYRSVRRVFVGGHGTVNHSRREYTRGETHTNTVENFFSVFKRGFYGTYQHMSAAHLKRYLAEFDFRYSNRSARGIEDVERADLALVGAKGKRLTYETTGQGRRA